MRLGNGFDYSPEKGAKKARWTPKSRIRIAIGTRSQFLSGGSRIRPCFHDSLANVPFDPCPELIILNTARVPARPVADRSPCSFSLPCSPSSTLFERYPYMTDRKRYFQRRWDSSLSSDLSFSCTRLSSYAGAGGGQRWDKG
jgi:hypothetical protein